jgi:hypothetical protein
VRYYAAMHLVRKHALHALIAETLESQFTEIAEKELLARHCTEAGLIEKAAGLWGKAGQRSLEKAMQAPSRISRREERLCDQAYFSAARRRGRSRRARSSLASACDASAC